ncbi:MAG: patatin-like phospholipase family protein [Oscillospiraceae bacterium]|nr:patatin-like phospholipase family protein [Oscillospiraceae bacterium]
MQEFTKDSSILQITDEIREKAANGQYIVSDIVLRENDREYQFVDLVMEGGGTLGIALVGYIHALEQAGIRFLGIGGSSVGAIVALVAYSCGNRIEEKGEKLAYFISEMDLGAMVDGKFFARRLSKLLGNRSATLRALRIGINAIFSLPSILCKLGLNPGDKLEKWISDRLLDNGIRSLGDLSRLIDTLPEGLTHRITGKPIIDYDTSLRIVVADITTSTKVVLPDMAPMYWEEPSVVDPACFARASASIPIFFQPFTVSGVSGLIGNRENWEKLGSFTGNIPDKVSFADGGVLSNFPIDLFDRHGVPRAPTFGARLGSKQRSVKEIKKIGQYAGALFESMRQYADYDFIFKNPLYNQLITHIPTEDYYWIDFAMSREDQQGLFREGVVAGYKFLESFDWAQYKQLRAAEIQKRKGRDNTSKIGVES